MITGFEKITEELSADELRCIGLLINGFKNRTKSNPIKAPAIITAMNLSLVKNNINIRLTEPRLRKLVNYIRSNSLLPLIATSAGYFCSTKTDEIIKEIASLTQRASAIMKSAEGLEKYLQDNLINCLPLKEEI